MGQQTLTNRVHVLERRVENLDQLPERMHSLELQFMQFREEVRVEFSATRGELRAEIRAGDERTRGELRAEIRAGDEQTRTELRAEIRAGDEQTRTELRTEIRAGDEQTRTELRTEIRAGDEEIRTYMRVLHEEVLSRIALLSEHRNGPEPSGRLSKGRRRQK